MRPLGRSLPSVHPHQHPPIRAIEIRDCARGLDCAREWIRNGLRLLLLAEIDGAGGFAVAERQMRAKFLRQRPHRVVLRTGGDAQSGKALAARLRDQSPKQRATDATTAHGILDAKGDLRLAVWRLLRRM